MDDHERELRRLRLAERERREDIEASEAELDAATRSLADALLDLGRLRGPVRLEAVDRTRSGIIVHVGEQAVTVRNDAGIDEVVSHAHIEGITSIGTGSISTGSISTVSQRSHVPLGSGSGSGNDSDNGNDHGRGKGNRPVRYGHPHSIVAFARSLIGETVRLERRSSPPVSGRIGGVSDDLIVVGGADRSEQLVPLACVVSICRH